MAQWKLQRRQVVCSACEHEFEDGERHISTLISGADDGLGRTDLCDRCWRGSLAQEVQEDPDVLFWWFTRHEEKKRQSVQLDMASLERLFVELEGREEHKVRELRYVLCLLLMRKRRVKLDKVLREDGVETFVVRRPKLDTRYRVHVFDFDVERVAEIRAELQAIFDGADGEEGISLAHLSDDYEAPVEESEEESAEGAPEVAQEDAEVEPGTEPDEGFEEGFEAVGESDSEETAPVAPDHEPSGA
ncbi:MAG: hypothetical protein ACI8QC_000134 [Planctomycetota bacterium]|jgi:hypothetical protein